MAVERRVRRDVRIKLLPMDDARFEVASMEDKKLIGSDEDYFIYMKNVNLRPSGEIEGRYLGENPSKIIDDACREIEFSTEDGKWKDKSNGKAFTSARMVAVNNKTGVTIIIQNN